MINDYEKRGKKKKNFFNKITDLLKISMNQMYEEEEQMSIYDSQMDE